MAAQSPVIKKADMELRPISVVRFRDNLMLGRALDIKSALAWGETVSSIPTKVYFYDDTFMLLEFCGKSKEQQFRQFIPWASIATVIFE